MLRLFLINRPFFYFFIFLSKSPPKKKDISSNTFGLIVDDEMRDRMERLVLLPFSVGCVSESSVAIGVHHPRRTKPSPHLSNPPPIRKKEEDEESLSSTESAKNSTRLPNITNGFHRLVKGLKSFSQLFGYEEEMEEVEMEIGVPTDVKHVTHIGWDGSENTNPMKGWDNLISPDLITVQFHELSSTAAQPHPSSSPLVRPSSV